MIKIKQHLSADEKQNVNYMLEDLNDVYQDFYITKNNLRLYIKENVDVLYQSLQKGDILAFDDEQKGIALINGFCDKAPRKYVKLVAKDEHTADQILKNIGWYYKIELWAKLKKNNPLVKVFQRNRFEFAGDRGKEILLVRKAIVRDNKFEMERIIAEKRAGEQESIKHVKGESRRRQVHGRNKN